MDIQHTKRMTLTPDENKDFILNGLRGMNARDFQIEDDAEVVFIFDCRMVISGDEIVLAKKLLETIHEKV